MRPASFSICVDDLLVEIAAPFLERRQLFARRAGGADVGPVEGRELAVEIRLRGVVVLHRLCSVGLELRDELVVDLA